MNIGIVGLGVVGKAVEHGFIKLGHKVYVHDIKLETKISNLISCEVIYVCVPTPRDHDGSCDISIVQEVMDDLSSLKFDKHVCIKSTVTPGTTRELIDEYPDLSISFVPEFLRERCALVDFVENHDVCIIGAHSEEAYEAIKESHGHFPERFVHLTPTEAEFAKYFNNVYNATLITFANSFYEVCKNMGASYQNVKNAIVHRKNISNVYLDCNDNLRGFGGMCLPKDVSAIASLSKKLDINVDFFDDILRENDKYEVTVFEGMRK